MILGNGNPIFHDKIKGVLKNGRIVIIQAEYKAPDNIDTRTMNFADGFFVIFGLTPWFVDALEIILGKALKTDKGISPAAFCIQPKEFSSLAKVMEVCPPHFFFNGIKPLNSSFA